jgi:hypothetical protein
MVVSVAVLAALAWSVLKPSATVVETGHGKPAIIETKELADFEPLPAGRKNLIETAIAVARNAPWLPYSYGVYDFRVPPKGSKSKLVGYGSPPGIPEITNPNPGELSP